MAQLRDSVAAEKERVARAKKDDERMRKYVIYHNTRCEQKVRQWDGMVPSTVVGLTCAAVAGGHGVVDPQRPALYYSVWHSLYPSAATLLFTPQNCFWRACPPYLHHTVGCRFSFDPPRAV